MAQFNQESEKKEFLGYLMLGLSLLIIVLLIFFSFMKADYQGDNYRMYSSGKYYLNSFTFSFTANEKYENINFSTAVPVLFWIGILICSIGSLYYIFIADGLISFLQMLLHSIGGILGLIASFMYLNFGKRVIDQTSPEWHFTAGFIITFAVYGLFILAGLGVLILSIVGVIIAKREEKITKRKNRELKQKRYHENLKEAKTLIKLGRKQKENGQYHHAKKSFEKALELVPRYATPKEELKDIKKLIEKQQADQLIAEGQELLSNYYFIKAIEKFDEAIKIYPKSTKANELKEKAREKKIQTLIEEFNALLSQEKINEAKAKIGELRNFDPTNLNIKKLQNKIQEAKDKVMKAKVKKREDTLRNIINTYSRIKLTNMAELLEFESTIELQRWILNLPDKSGFYIEGSEVVIAEKLQKETSEAEAAIAKLLNDFEQFEQEGRGKV
ncbi:MAG: hypothetical protein GF308_20280 [Candidatus Heimdallarchaeota archaeon]|nr:hypothetical protein [Candidatus Heimdallarchaeota archaeon]